MFLQKYLSRVKKSWLPFFNNEFKKEYFIKLNVFLEKEYQNKVIFPKPDNIFNAFTFFELEDTNLVIIGQDPYQTPNMADGLAFSTKLNIQPKSLSNLFKEIKKDFNINRTNYDLSDIASQNVLLLNRILTVESNLSLSHAEKGWETFTNNLILYLSIKNQHIIYLFMGNKAISLKPLLFNYLKVFETSHPSPFSYRINLEDKQIFKKINEQLIKANKKPIKW
ncbi:MAG: uracil-DNA glycosylase [Malacoplasma sp.]|nr:uracil-DNA glycosylase [Malacoplasma sp.]MDE6893815.1 uracil-DNA glycosylase [Malacoplasma sp.]